MLLTGAMLLGQPGQAAAMPAMVLPEADLVCDGTVVGTAGWVTKGGPPTLWITTGPLTGHYVVLSQTHFEGPPQMTPADVPEDFSELEPVIPPQLYGKKSGLDSLECTFLSRWSDFTVYGPITIARVS